jgi:peptidoglycan/LPS O-acetylase OafA/YrhL
MGYARPFELELNAPIARVEAEPLAANKLLGLEVLRFLSALAVLFWHYSHFGQIAGMQPVERGTQPFHAPFWLFYDYGLYGVQVFWGISGFIFFWKYGAAIHAKAVSARDFFWLRFSRLYPLHIATLFAVVALQAVHRHYAGGDFVYPTDDYGLFTRQLFLATDWGPPPPFSFNGPIWSISAEVAVYAAFFAVLTRFAPTMKLCVAVIVVSLGLQLAGLNWAGPFCATYFFAGGMAALVGSRMAVPAAIGLASVLVLSIASRALGNPDKMPMILLVAVPCALVLLSRDWLPLQRWQRQVQFAGNLTYSSYLLHFPLQLMTAIAVAATGIVLPVTSAWLLIAYLGTTLGVAALSYRWFELPAQRWIRQRTVRRAA